MMLKSRVEKMLHARYSQRGADGVVQCSKCPLRVASKYARTACKANHSWNPVDGEWEPDELKTKTRREV